MKIEAFTEGKDPDAPEANEDRFLVVQGRGYAVLDGVTDTSGERYDGMRSGWHASRTAVAAVADALFDPAERATRPDALLERVSASLRALYARLSILDAARADPARRFGATLALAVDLGETFRFVLVGDSGLRINGVETVADEMALDRVTARLRVEAYALVTAAGGGAEDRARAGTACAVHGAARLHHDMRPTLDDAARQRIYDRTLAWCSVSLPHVPAADIRHMLDTGVNGQTRFQNNTISPFSYALLDGFSVPPSLVRVIDRPRATIRTIELFTDGYFQPGARPALADWEAGFAEVERVDPEKTGRYPSMKGSAGRRRTDDRTVVIVHL